MANNSGIKINLISEFEAKGLKDAGKQFETFGSKVAQWGKNFGKVIAAAVVAIGALAVKLGVDAVKAAIKAEAAQNRLNQILLTTGGATRKQIDALDDQAKALERVGVVSAENVKVVQSQLATFDLQYETLRDLTPAILDYVTAEKGATATTEDFKAMTNGLAQALQGNFASLTRTGFVLDETTKNMIANGSESQRTAALVQVLNSTYKGFNETLTETTEGKLQQLNNQLGSLRDAIGVALLPYVNKMVDVFVTKVLPVLEKLSSWIVNSVIPAIEKAATWVWNELSPAFKWFSDYLEQNVVPFLKQLWAAFQHYVIPAIIDTYNYLKDRLGKAFQNMKTFVEENKDALYTLAKILAVILYGAFKAILWILERVADFFAAATGKMVEMGRAIKILSPYIQDAYNKLKLFLTALGYINPMARFAVQGLEAIERGIQNIANADWGSLGQNASENWLAGWGVGWNSVTEDAIPKVKDFFGTFKDTVVSGTSDAVSKGTDKLKEKMDNYKETLKSKLEEVKEQFKNFRDEVRSVIVDAIDFGAAWQDVEDAKKEAAENGEEFGGSFLDALIAQAQKATEFAQKIQTLVEMGLSKDAISEVLAAGATAGTAIADELIAGGSDAINKTNELVDSTKKAANKVAKFAADSYYGTGVDTAKKMVQGFKDLVKEGGKGFDELMKAMDKLAKKLARSVEIKIKATSGSTEVEIPALAKGGIVRKPTLALIGESGPEAVVPLKPRGPSYGIDPVGHGGITINVSGALDPEAVARQIETILKRSTLRAGAY